MATFSLQALHDEIENDPLGLGYKEVGGAWKGDAVIADLLNATTGPGAAQITRKLVQPKEILESLDLAEWESLAVGRRQYVQILCAGEVVDATKTPVFDALSTIFSSADAPITRAEILSKIQRTGSRAEVLWGENTVISVSQVGQAANL